MSNRGSWRNHRGPVYQGLPRYEDDVQNQPARWQGPQMYSVPTIKEESGDGDGFLEQEPLNLRGDAGRWPSNDPNVGYGAVTRDFQRHYGARPPQWGATFRADGPGDLQTYYQSLGEYAQAHTARKHDNKKQFIHLISGVFLRWLVTLVFSVLLVVCCQQYEKVKVLERSSRRWFNAFSTGICLVLTLNIAGSLRSIATFMRWKLLARKKHQLDEVDFILGISSLQKCSRYGLHVFRRRPWTCLACIGWLSINVVGRLFITLAGLTYSYDSAKAILLNPGTVNVTSWDSFSGMDQASTERYVAHLYGTFSVMLTYQNLTTPGAQYDLNMPFKDPIEVNTTDNTYHYYFRDYSPDISTTYGILAHKSSRYISVNSKCDSYPLIKGQHGDSSTVTYMKDGTEHSLHNISEYGPSGTVWVNPRSDLNRNKAWDCGPRCAAIAAIRFVDSNSNSNGSFYDCEVTLSKVQGATSKVHEISDTTAEIAAGAIGFAGYSRGPDQWEYVNYPRTSPWSNFNSSTGGNDAENMAKLAMRFSIGTIASKDLSYLYGSIISKNFDYLYRSHTTTQAEGMVASAGVHLEIKWRYLWIILSTLLGAQLVVGVVAVAYANTVFCKDDNYLSIARLLRPIVERLGPRGCAMSGVDISHTLSQFMVYGVRSDESGIRHHLDIGEDIVAREWFPEGWYDGDGKEWLGGKLKLKQD